MRDAVSESPSTRRFDEPCEGDNVHGIEFGPYPRIAFGIVFHDKDAGPIPRILALAYLAFAIEIPAWLAHELSNIGVLSLQGVEDVVSRGDV